MPLPPGFALDTPAPAAGGPEGGLLRNPGVKLPAGFTLDTPGQAPVAAPAPAAPAQQDNSLLGKVSTFASGFDRQTLSNLNPITVVKSLLHPVDTYEADAHQRIQILNQAEQDFHNGHYGSAAIHALDGIVPFLGPVINEVGQAAASGDPARQGRALANLVSFKSAPEAYGAVGRVAADVAPKIAPAIDATRNAAADSLQTSAEKNIATALNPTTKVNKALVENKLARGVVDRGIVATSLKGLQAKAQAGIEKYGQQVDDIFDKHADLGTTVSPKPIIAALEQEKAAYTVAGVPINKPYINTLADLQQQIQDVSDAKGGAVPVADLRQIRQIHDKTIAQSKNGFALPPDAASQVDALKTYRGAIADSLAKEIPELVEPNAETSFYKDLDKVVGDTLQRKVGQKRGLTAKIGEILGGGAASLLTHNPLTVYGGAKLGGKLADFQSSGLWNTLSANVKSRIASLLETGDEASLPSNGVVPNQAPAATSAAANLSSSGGSNAPTNAAANAGASPQGQGVPAAVRATAAPEGVGAGTTVKVPGQAGRGYQAQYKLQELDSLNASHNGLTFSPNAEYRLTNDRNYANKTNQGKVVNWSSRAEFDPSYHVTDNPDATNGPVVTDSQGNVIGGNGRTMILERVYNANPKGAAAYRGMLEQKAAQFGIDPAAAASMKQPVLTRAIADAEFGPNSTKQQAVTDFNKKGTAELTPGERAIADSRRVSTGTLDDVAARLDAKGSGATIAQVLDGKPGGEVLDKLIADGVISPQERGALADQNGLTKAGRDRISQLVVGRFFRDPAQLDAIAPAVRAKVERMAAPLAQVEAKAGWDLTPHVQQAIEIVEAARAAGIKGIGDFLAQDGLFGKDKYAPQAVAIAKALQASKSTEVMAAARQYAQDASYADKGQTLMGDAPTPAESFKASFGALKSGAASEAAQAMAKRKGARI
jgi:hypothetical protein